MTGPTVRQLAERDATSARLLGAHGCRRNGGDIMRRGRLIGRFDAWSCRVALVAGPYPSGALRRAFYEAGWTVDDLETREALRQHTFPQTPEDTVG